MTLFVGDVREGLRQFIADGVRAQTCVTSPPYWGLRDYGTAQWDGGASDCDHKQTVARHDGGRVNVDGFNGSARPDSDKGAMNYRGSCGKCGAHRIDRQLGLEPTIAEYVANMVEVFRLVRDVLADDGTLWLNLGDSYAGGGRAGSDKALNGKQGSNRGSLAMVGRSFLPEDLDAKQLCGIPWRVAFALQADGWYLRSDIIWAKPNPMPESVTDRPTKAHEYLFLLAKRERYYYDADAIRELTGSEMSMEEYAAKTAPGATWQTGGIKHYAGAHKTDGGQSHPLGRNRRSVWTINSEPFPDAHFATFPTALVEPCIAAGSRVGDIVLDPFMGSGTVAQVAQDLGRRWIGCELNPDYAKMIRQRTAQQGLALAAD